MIIKKGFIAAPPLAAVALGVSSAVFAAPPEAISGVSFDQWTVDDGDIDISCPATYSCGGIVTGKGFYQDMITDSDGNSFFRTVVTEKDSGNSTDGTASQAGVDNAEIRFYDENYVSMDNQNGIADNSVIHEATSTDYVEDGFTYSIDETFIASTKINTGFASSRVDGADELELYQGLAQVDTGNTDFRTDFWLDQAGQDGAIEKSMLVSGKVELEDGGGDQDFMLVAKSKGAVTEGGTITDMGGDPTNDLTWSTSSANASVQAVWIGQTLDVISQEFGFTSYTNNDTSGSPSEAGFIDDFSLAAGSASAPLQWDTGFWGEYEPPAYGDSYPPASF